MHSHPDSRAVLKSNVITFANRAHVHQKEESKPSHQWSTYVGGGGGRDNVPGMW